VGGGQRAATHPGADPPIQYLKASKGEIKQRPPWGGGPGGWGGGGGGFTGAKILDEQFAGGVDGELDVLPGDREVLQNHLVAGQASKHAPLVAVHQPYLQPTDGLQGMANQRKDRAAVGLVQDGHFLYLPTL